MKTWRVQLTAGGKSLTATKILRGIFPGDALSPLPIVIGAFGTVTKGLLKGLEDLEVGGRVETIQMTALSKNRRRIIDVQNTEKTWGDLLSLWL